MYKIIKKNEWKSAKWSGGITNEIFIYPSSGNYAERNFKARISVATTEVEEKSKFTDLPGVDRFISKLDGKMFLEHIKHYDMEVEKYQIDHFDGEWETYSTGKFRDFNLMLKGVRGNLCFIELSSSAKLHLEHDSTISFVFLLEGKLKIDGVELEKEDFYYTDNSILEVQTNSAKLFYGFIKEWD